MNGGRRRIIAPPTNARKDRDEDLLLFREMHKRDKERITSLLQPVSDEIEPNTGNYRLYKIAPAKKGSGYDFITESDKNDYDWLKTPPATPLFQSLEMEANAPQLAVQREIPIIHPLSQLSGNSKSNETTKSRTKSSNTKPQVPSRSGTPSPLSTMTIKINGTKLLKNQKTTQLGGTDLNKETNITTMASKPVNQKECPSNFLASYPTRNAGRDTIPGISNETPPNLRTDRSLSASRGRHSNPTVTIQPKPESIIKPRRQSCSPSMTRGRKLESKQEIKHDSTISKGRIQTANGSLAFGSRMVEKVMNSRKSASGEDHKESKPKSKGSSDESSVFGRMALKHMETKQGSISYRHPDTASGRNSITMGSTSSSQSTPRAGQVHEAGNQHWKKM